MSPTVLVQRTPDLLCAAAAARLITVLLDVQATGRIPAIALTGGGVGTGTLAALKACAANAAVDWTRVEMFWGDERFVPADDSDRNERQARDALLDHLELDPARVHPMAASDGEFGDDLDAAAAGYAQIVAGRLGVEPVFDVVMLGMGPEGHVASVFPGSPAVASIADVVAVRDCPKPPPNRISLTLPTIRRSREVWILTAGAEKADAVARAMAGTPEVELPVSGAVGIQRTLFLLDEQSAAKIASPTSP